VTFAWQLPGTPATAGGATVTFAPSEAGTGVVRVTATDSSGLAAAAQKAVTIAPRSDRKKPTVTLKKIKTVRRPHRSTIKGRATDASGIARVTVRFGDGKKRRAKLTGNGRFTIKHRYGKARSYKVRATAIDEAGNSRTAQRKARVRKAR
jgi:translation initiation factor IF-1